MAAMRGPTTPPRLSPRDDSMDITFSKGMGPVMTAWASPEEQEVLKGLDIIDANGMLSLPEVIAGVKKVAESEHQMRLLRRRQICLIVGFAITLVLAAAMVFTLSFAASVQAKSLFVSSPEPGNLPSLVNEKGEHVQVSEAKVAVPLGLAPFLSAEQLRDIEVVGYYDCRAEEEIWGRVVSVRHYVPWEPAESDPAASAQNESSHKYSVTFLLATGRHLVVDSEGEYIDFPEENRTQELCGEMRCAQLHLQDVDVDALEHKAQVALGDYFTDAPNRRLQGRGGRNRGRRNRGRRGQQCRRCNAPPHPVPRPPAPAPAPAPSACSQLPATSTPVQEATVKVAQAICLQLSSANSRTARADILGGLVRLAFHDAGSFDGTTGGADGCVDVDALENRGLSAVIESLAPVVSSVSGILSRADVWALASAVAIEAAGGPQLSFSFGRADSESCAGQGSRHPNAEGNHDHIRDVMVTRLGFTEQDVVALLGAHVLGRATPGISGYDGAWVRRSDRFTNDYFRDLLVVPWRKADRPNFEGNARTQWNGRGNTMMLNTDIEIAFDTSTGCTRAGGRGGGGNGRCQRAAHGFSDAVTEFSVNQDAFFTAFAPAFQSLVALGATNLECVFPDCSTPGPL